MSYIREQLPYTLDAFEGGNLGERYKGKVRENFHMGNEIIMVTTDRVSAFDHVLGTIPFKGQILNEIALFWFEKTKHIVPNHIISSPDPQVLLAKKVCKIFPGGVLIKIIIKKDAPLSSN